MKNYLKKILNMQPAIPTLLAYIPFLIAHNKLTRTKTSIEAGSKHIMNSIKSKGYFVIRQAYTKEYCESVIKEIERIFKDYPEFVHHSTDLRLFGSECLSEKIKEFYNNSSFESIAEFYMQTKVINAFTLAGKVDSLTWNENNDGWHRDLRFRQFKSFLYLNDVTDENGAFEIIEGSHLLFNHLIDVSIGKLSFTENRFRDEQIEAIVQRTNPSRRKKITGEAGTVILVDTGTLHRGSPPIKGIRYALTNYYFEKKDLDPKVIGRFKSVNEKELEKVYREW